LFLLLIPFQSTTIKLLFSPLGQCESNAKQSTKHQQSTARDSCILFEFSPLFRLDVLLKTNKKINGMK
jgi:hypothetical protein